MFVAHTGAFRTEQHPDLFPPRDIGAHFRRQPLWGKDRLDRVARPRGRHINPVQIRKRIFFALEHLGIVDDNIGARCIGRRPFIGPTITRPHQTQVNQSAIKHGARRLADIIAKLRFNQDDDRRIGYTAGFGSCAIRHSRVCDVAHRLNSPVFAWGEVRACPSILAFLYQKPMHDASTHYTHE